MSTEVKVRLKITLSTEQFQGRDHQGQSSVAYMLNHPVIIFDHQGQLRWRQGRDQAGHIDQEHLPGGGPVELADGNCTLKQESGSPVVTMANFTNPVSNQNGIAQYLYKNGAYGAQPSSRIDWVGRGAWEVVENRSTPPPVRYVFSGWRFNTSAGSSISALVAENGQGTIVLTDPYNRNRRFHYGGLGPCADAGKLLKYVKALKDLVWVEKVAKVTGSKPLKGGASASTEDMFSKGFIMKNVAKIGFRELTPEDFCGMCVWVDGSIGVGKALSVMFLFSGVFRGTIWDLPVPSAVIPCGGVVNSWLSAGAGLCFGGITLES